VSEPGVSAGAPVSRVLRFGQRITRADLPFALQTGGSGVESAVGTLIGVHVTKDASDIWLRLGIGGLLRPTKYQTIHVYGSGPEDAPPDGFLLHDDLRVRCHEGYVGKVDGLALDLRTGVALGLLLHVRSDVLSAITRASDPYYHLLPLAGQRILTPMAWMRSIGHAKAALPFLPTEETLDLDASVEQVASATVVRADADLEADVIHILEENLALAPLLARISIQVREGIVRLRGEVPTERHKASIEQDVWHVPGVNGVRNELRALTQ
jgi:BON domain-containing protein